MHIRRKKMKWGCKLVDSTCKSNWVGLDENLGWIKMFWNIIFMALYGFNVLKLSSVTKSKIILHSTFLSSSSDDFPAYRQ